MGKIILIYIFIAAVSCNVISGGNTILAKIAEQEKKNDKGKEAIKTISWEDADKYYGKLVIVEGKIIITNDSGKACFFNFHKNWKKYFTAVIFKSDFKKFPPHPEEYYKDKQVKIKGVIKEYQGKPEILITSADQIEIVNKK